jgi:hypothetical protein
MWAWASSSRALVLLVALVAQPSNVAPSAAGKVYLTPDEALKLALPGCVIERSTVYLTDEQKARVEKLAGSALESAIVYPYVGKKDGTLVGTVYFETHRVRTLRETLLVLVDRDSKVGRIELLAFGEPDEYAPKGEWYAQFVGKPLDDELALKRSIRGIAGASLTARATTDAVRRVLALHQTLDPKPVPQERGK